MEKIIILGTGNMGSYIASRLSNDCRIAVADYDQSNLDKISNNNIEKYRVDLSQPSTVRRVVEDSNLVVSCLSESIGYNAVKEAIKSGKNVVDISFWTQNKKKLAYLERLVQKYETTVFIDFGVAPGLSNGLVSYFDLLLDGKTENVAVYVGGIPANRERGFFSSWSINGLFEEYRRDALRVRNGIPERVAALSLIEIIDFPGVGKLEAGITDGLRTLPYSLPHVKSMNEFTLRYPGYYQQMKVLSDLGYFNEGMIKTHKDDIAAAEFSGLLMKGKDSKYKAVLDNLGFLDVNEKHRCDEEKISPRKIAASVLSKTWEMRPDDRDLLVMRVRADDGKTGYVADLYAEHDGTNSAMALTTGGMAVLGARAITERLFEKKGVFPLENVIKEDPEMIHYFISGMKCLGIKYGQREE